MQSAFKHELHNMELIIIRYRIPLSVIPATSWYEHDQFEMLWEMHTPSLIHLYTPSTVPRTLSSLYAHPTPRRESSSTQQMGGNHLTRRWRRSGTRLHTRTLITTCFRTSSPHLRFSPCFYTCSSLIPISSQNNSPLITFSHWAQSCYICSQIWCF